MWAGLEGMVRNIEVKKVGKEMRVTVTFRNGTNTYTFGGQASTYDDALLAAIAAASQFFGME